MKTPGPHPAESVVLREHLQACAAKQERAFTKAFKRCWKKFSEKSVHQLRVDLRRLLALLDLLGTVLPDDDLASTERGLKKLLKNFTRLRDTHVQLLYLQRRLNKFAEAIPFQARLLRRERRLIRRAERRFTKGRKRAILRLLSSMDERLGAVFQDPEGEARRFSTLPRQIDRQFAKVDALRRRIDPDRPITIHRTRLAFKRFRYMVELLQPVLPGITPARVCQMHAYQTMMGEIQDVEVLLSALDKFIRKQSKHAGSLRPFRDEVVRHHRELVTNYLQVADRLSRFWPPRGAAAGVTPGLHPG